MKQALLLILWSGLHAAQPVLTVRVFQYAAIPDGQIARAEEEAGLIFGRAGIRISWVDCRNANPACRKGLAGTEIVLRSLPPHVADGARGTLGWGWAGAYANVYPAEISAKARHAFVDEGLLLGIVVAHEIGHTLLGPNSHSRTGVMSAHLAPTDLESAVKRWLVFTPEQGRRLRAEVASRAGTAASVAARRRAPATASR
jgi:hypothetical protein